MGTRGKTRARPTGVTRWRFIWTATLACAFVACVAFGQRPFRDYPGWEYNDFPKPSDWKLPGEWTFARLMYPDVRYSDRPFRNFLNGGSNWTIDYPRSDRHLVQAVRRLTRIHAAAGQMTHRVQDLMLLARMEAGERPPLRDGVELDSIALEATDMFRARARTLGQHLQLDLR